MTPMQNKHMDKLKVKLVKEKPKKVYAITVEYDYHIEELIEFLGNNKDKKFDIIVNGKLFKFASVAAKNKFAEGFKSSSDILLSNVYNANKQFVSETAKLTLENNTLKKEAQQIGKEKELYWAKNAAMTVRVAAWQDRITELEDTCEALRKVIDEIKNGKQIDL